MEPYLGLKYKMTEEENFDDLMKFLGYNFVQRKLAGTLNPTQGIVLNDDGTYTIHFWCLMVNHDVRFTPGVEFVETKPDGVKVQARVILEGNKAIHTQREDNGRTVKHVYEFHADKMTITTTAEGMKKVVKRHYKLVK